MNTCFYLLNELTFYCQFVDVLLDLAGLPEWMVVADRTLVSGGF